MKKRLLSLATATFALTAWAAFAADSKPPMDYYKVVTEKNLFRKLGWTLPDNRPRFTLILTALAPDDPQEEEAEAAEDDFWASILGQGPEPVDESPEPEDVGEPRKSRAMIARQGQSNAFYVEEGDEFEGMTVVSIGLRSVTLTNGEGEETALSLQEGAIGGAAGGSGGGGGGRRGGGGPSARPSGPSGPPGGMPDFSNFAGRFGNMSPEQREEMRARFRQGGFGGGRGGGRRGGR